MSASRIGGLGERAYSRVPRISGNERRRLQRGTLQPLAAVASTSAKGAALGQTGGIGLSCDDSHDDARPSTQSLNDTWATPRCCWLSVAPELAFQDGKRVSASATDV